jgi:hypothetical protein
VPTHIL